MTTRRPMAPQNSRNAPFRSGMVTAMSASRASPSSARSATKRSRSKFMLAPLSTATSTCPRAPESAPSRSTHALSPAAASAPAGSMIVRVSSKMSLMAAHTSSLVTRTTSSTVSRASANVSSPDFAHGHTVGEEADVVEVDARAGLQRPVHRVGLERLDADDLHVGPQRLDVPGDAGDEAAAADGHEDGREMVLAVTQDLGADRPLPGDDERIVEGMNERHPGLGDQRVAVRLRVAVACRPPAPPRRPSLAPHPP